MAETPISPAAFDPAMDGPFRSPPASRRLTAPNPGPFTAPAPTPTSSAPGRVAVIDPGPGRSPPMSMRSSPRWPARPSRHILLTHTHRDHSGALAALKAATGAPAALGRPAPPRPRRSRPARRTLRRRQRHRPSSPTAARRWRQRSTATAGGSRRSRRPGIPPTTSPSPCPAPISIFSGDHVMGWSTSIVAPPDGVDGRLHGLARPAGGAARAAAPPRPRPSGRGRSGTARDR